MRAVLKALALIVAIGIVAGTLTFIWIGSRGISARAQPGRIETAVARTMRRLAIPRKARNTPNPVAVSPDVIAAAMSHWADHCAGCHANDGSGETEIGLGLYPKPPDMRRPATQALTDGELFYIIENGVRLTGMPAWGDGTTETATHSWHLVHLIRKLPTLTPDELHQMEQMNPKSPAEPTEPHGVPHKHGAQSRVGDGGEEESAGAADELAGLGEDLPPGLRQTHEPLHPHARCS